MNFILMQLPAFNLENSDLANFITKKTITFNLMAGIAFLNECEVRDISGNLIQFTEIISGSGASEYVALSKQEVQTAIQKAIENFSQQQKQQQLSPDLLIARNEIRR